MLYMAQISLDEQLIDVVLYEDYEHFLSDLTRGDLALFYVLENNHKDIYDAIDFEHPHISTVFEDDNGFGCKFSYSYREQGVLVTCERPVTREGNYAELHSDQTQEEV